MKIGLRYYDIITYVSVDLRLFRLKFFNFHYPFLQIYKRKKVGNVCTGAKWSTRQELIAVSRLVVFLLLLDGMLLHRNVNPSIKFAVTHLYTWVEREALTVRCISQIHNAVFPGPLDSEWTALNMIEVIASPNLQTCVIKKIHH